jgi:hypothetical protein
MEETQKQQAGMDRAFCIYIYTYGPSVLETGVVQTPQVILSDMIGTGKKEL